MGIERVVARGDVRDVVAEVGEVFAVFDANTQDSGHISYGVRGASGKKWFVKTSGDGGECYHQGSYVNDVGRLPGSTRFMAPEEFTKGATVDARTTIFTLGRMIETFLLSGHSAHPAHEIACAATQNDPADRPQTLADFQGDWRSACR